MNFGVENSTMSLKQANQLLDSYQYPVSTEQLIAAHGDYVIDLPNGTETLEEVLRRAGDETYDSPHQARDAMYGAVSSKAIGRKHYSDRDPTTMGTNGPNQLSF